MSSSSPPLFHVKLVVAKHPAPGELQRIDFYPIHVNRLVAFSLSTSSRILALNISRSQFSLALLDSLHKDVPPVLREKKCSFSNHFILFYFISWISTYVIPTSDVRSNTIIYLSFSDPRYVTSGFPQGGVLYPVLFSIYACQFLGSDGVELNSAHLQMTLNPSASIIRNSCRT